MLQTAIYTKIFVTSRDIRNDFRIKKKRLKTFKKKNGLKTLKPLIYPENPQKPKKKSKKGKKPLKNPDLPRFTLKIALQTAIYTKIFVTKPDIVTKSA
jgi:hypothetical protein